MSKLTLEMIEKAKAQLNEPSRRESIALSPTSYQHAVIMVHAGFCKINDIKGDGTCSVLWVMYQAKLQDEHQSKIEVK